MYLKEKIYLRVIFLLLLTLSAFILIPSVSVAKSKVIAKGYCGEKSYITEEKRTDLKWELRKNGTMIISGKGNMVDFPEDTLRNWDYMRKIKKVVFKEGIEYVGEEAFCGCKNLKKIVWAKSIKEVGSDAFACCYSLKKVEIPTGVERWGKGVFSYSGLKEVTIPASRTYWEADAFAECDDLKKVVFEEGIKFRILDFEDDFDDETSGTRMFSNCKSLKEVVFPKKMKVIPDYIFDGCDKLKKYQWPDGVKYKGWSPEKSEE